MPGRPFEGLLFQLCGGGRYVRGQLARGGQDDVALGSRKGEEGIVKPYVILGKYK